MWGRCPSVRHRQGHAADPVAVGHHPQPLAHKRTVDADERRDIGHGGEGHKVERPHQVRAFLARLTQFTGHIDEHQEHDRGGAQMGQIATFVLAVRVHHRHAIRQGFPAEVVVQNDHIRTFGRRDGAVRQGATIDADDQVVIAGKGGHRGLVGAIALVDAVGDIECTAAAHIAQPRHKQRRRGAAIDIVIGENGDAFALFGGGNKPCRGLVHIQKRGGIGQQVFEGRGQKRRRRLRGDTAPRQGCDTAAGGRPVCCAIASARRWCSGEGPTQRRGGKRGGDIEKIGHGVSHGTRYRALRAQMQTRRADGAARGREWCRHRGRAGRTMWHRHWWQRRRRRHGPR